MKRTLSLFLSMLLAFGMLFSTAVPAAAAGDPTITVDAVTGELGETVEVNITVTDNPGIASMSFDLNYDSSVLTIESIENKVPATVQTMDSKDFTQNPYKFVWTTFGLSSFDTTGVFAVVTFRVNENAAYGTSDITVTYDDTADITDVNDDPVAFNVANGSVTINEPPHVHSMKHTAAVDPTCSAAGNVEYWYCSSCEKYFSDEEGTTEIADVTLPIDPNAHVWGEWVVTKEPTVEADGEKTRTCTLCNETETEKVPFHCDHDDMQHVEAKDPNCQDAGNIEYWKCDNCGRYYADENGETEIEESSIEIPADPDKHTWGEPTYECNEDHTVGTAKHTCEICGKEETEEVTPIVENIAATCDKPSFIKITAKFTKDGFEEQSCMEEGEEEALGHDYSAAPTFTWSSDYKSAKAVFTCKRDASHKKEVTATVTSETEDNETTYTAKVTLDGKTYTDTKTVSEQTRPQQNPNDIIYIPRINGGISKSTKDVRPTREPDPVPGTKTAATPAPAPAAEPAIPQVVNELPFIDVFVTDAYYGAVKFVYDNGLFKGVSDKEFDPSGTMTRAMFVTVLGRLAKVDVSAYTESSFTDVEPIGTWDYAPYVEWAAQNGIVLGYGDGRFGPNDLITKEQAAVIIARYAKYTGVDTSSINTLAGYADGETVSDWAFDAVAWADDVNIYVLENGLLNPQAPASRAVVATMLWAYVK